MIQALAICTALMGQCGTNDLGTRIDVLICYTPTIANNPGLKWIVANEVDPARAALAPYDVYLHVEYEEVGYHECTAPYPPSLRTRMADCDDGVLDDVCSYREQHGSDVVILYEWEDAYSEPDCNQQCVSGVGICGGPTCWVDPPYDDDTYASGDMGVVNLQQLLVGNPVLDPGCGCASTIDGYESELHFLLLAMLKGTQCGEFCETECNAPAYEHFCPGVPDPDQQILTANYRSAVWCPEDHNGDGQVNNGDLNLVLTYWDWPTSGQSAMNEVFAAWGSCFPASPLMQCPADDLGTRIDVGILATEQAVAWNAGMDQLLSRAESEINGYPIGHSGATLRLQAVQTFDWHADNEQLPNYLIWYIRHDDMFAWAHEWREAQGLDLVIVLSYADVDGYCANTGVISGCDTADWYDFAWIAVDQYCQYEWWWERIDDTVWAWAQDHVEEPEVLANRCPATWCPADHDMDQQVGVSDLALVVGMWGITGDMDALLEVLGSWGSCFDAAASIPECDCEQPWLCGYQTFNWCHDGGTSCAGCLQSCYARCDWFCSFCQHTPFDCDQECRSGCEYAHALCID